MNLLSRTALLMGLVMFPAIALAECSPHAITMKDSIFTVGATVGVTLVAGLILNFTLASSLAGSGYRQTAANAASFGLAGFLGGSAGSVYMAMHDCGVANIHGGASIALALLGGVVMLFSLTTGKG